MMAPTAPPELCFGGTALCARAEAVIDAIRPRPASYERRLCVQEYVRQLIARCFLPEQVRAVQAGLGGSSHGGSGAVVRPGVAATRYRPAPAQRVSGAMWTMIRGVQPDHRPRK
jgi:hypothetical protein